MGDEKKESGGVSAVVELVRDIVRAFVWFPEKVEVTVEGDSSRGNVTILKLDVDANDYGLVVGRAARKIQALRTIVQFLGMHDGRQFRLIFPERDRFDRETDSMRAPFQPNPNWKSDDAVSLLERVLKRILVNPFRVEAVSAPEQTLIEIYPHNKEHDWANRMKPYIHTVFHAIGKQNGAELYVEVPEAAPTPP